MKTGAWHPQAEDALPMFELAVNQLHLTVHQAAGHEHRIEPVTRRALRLVAERLPIDLGARAHVGSLTTGRVGLPLGALSDEEAADRLAGAILEMLTPRLRP